MSFFNKIFQNKGLAAAVVGGVAATIGLVALYKSYKSEEGGQQYQNAEGALNLDKEMNALKQQINSDNPSLQDVKLILEFSMSFTKKKLLVYSKQYKNKRRQFAVTGKNTNFSEYMNVVVNGMEQVQNIATSTQTEIFQKLNVNQMVFAKYQNQLGMFMQQLMMQSQTPEIKPMSLQEVKFAIRLQIQFLKNHGEQIANKVIEATSNWPANRKASVPLLLSVVIADGAFDQYPEINEQAIQMAEMQMQSQLVEQLEQMRTHLMPLMQKMSAGLSLGGMGGMGGMGAMGDFGGMGGMGDFGGMEEGDPFANLSPQQMEQIRQLEQLRMQDPAAFEQMMNNMYQ